jgi:hypothetical protein
MKRELPTQISVDMTRQQLFDYVTHFIHKQGKPSLNRKNGVFCSYRGTHKTMCAFGCIIPDEVYDGNMENKTVRELLSADFSNFRSVEPEYWGFVYKHQSLIEYLQHNHDSLARRSHNYSVEDFRMEWLTQVGETADKFGLAFSRNDY